jgi:hypothetical protein
MAGLPYGSGIACGFGESGWSDLPPIRSVRRENNAVVVAEAGPKRRLRFMVGHSAAIIIRFFWAV